MGATLFPGGLIWCTPISAARGLPAVALLAGLGNLGFYLHQWLHPPSSDSKSKKKPVLLIYSKSSGVYGSSGRVPTTLDVVLDEVEVSERTSEMSAKLAAVKGPMSLHLP
ncbi:hypothetical protein H2248_005014 [Termitomyces sp. 'cryptogamus']|nr:hypothetical protein H2248_005014 [Termitomyces sp. 'cryptogamus']